METHATEQIKKIIIAELGILHLPAYTFLLRDV